MINTEQFALIMSANMNDIETCANYYIDTISSYCNIM